MFIFACCPAEEDCICTGEYAPVCGDNGVEYGNSCFADCKGVAYTQGPCPIITEALVIDLGPIEVDGCGWVLHFDYKKLPS